MREKHWIYSLSGIAVILALTFFLYPRVDGFQATASADERETFSSTQVEAMHLMQIVTADSRTSRTISWQSEHPQDDAMLEYRTEGAQSIAQSAPEASTFATDERTVYLYTARLTGLASGTAYEYRVVSGGRQTQWQRFDTQGQDSFKALIFPDSQSADYGGWAKLAQTAWQANPDARFFVNMGDLVDNGDVYWQWRSWLTAVDRMIARIPLVPVQGNHETYTRDWKVQMPKTFLALFQTPDNGNPDRRNQYYSFDYGDVHFAVFNTQYEEVEDFQPGLLAEELAWLEQDLAKTERKWKIVLLHKDLLRYPRKDGDGTGEITELGRTLMPMFDRYRVDAVLSAHLHTYRRRQPIRDFVPNPDGALYILTGVAGDVRYSNLWRRHDLDAAIAPQPETDNYMTLEVDANNLKFAAFLPSGEKIDEVVLRKK